VQRWGEGIGMMRGAIGDLSLEKEDFEGRSLLAGDLKWNGEQVS